MKGDGLMDKKKGSVGKWDWLPAQMPGVVRLVAEKRKLLGNAHVNLCWKNGVELLQPGWFYAREGALTVGTPWPLSAEAEHLSADFARTRVVLVLREPEPADGAH